MLQSGCTQGLTPLLRALGKKFRPLFVLIIGCAKTKWFILRCPSVVMVSVTVRQAPLALVGFKLKATARE